MSRSYIMNCQVTGIETNKEAELIQKELEGFFPEASNYEHVVEAYDDNLQLGGGTDTPDWEKGVVENIWRAVKRPVQVEFDWWYKDRSPDESNIYDAEEFAEMFPALTQLAMAAEEED